MSKEVLTIRLTEKEKKILTNKAQKSGSSLSNFARRLLLQQLSHPFESNQSVSSLVNLENLILKQEKISQEMNLNFQKSHKFQIAIARSILQNRFFIGKLFKLFVDTYEGKLPPSTSLPTNTEKNQFIMDELKNIQGEIDAQ